MILFEENNLTSMFYRLTRILHKAESDGDVKRIRNSVIEFRNAEVFTPLFEGYRYNPAYQLFQFVWAMLGETDTDALLGFNEDGEEFTERADMDETLHAPLGERVRFYGQSKYAGEVINPLDQLKAVYNALLLSPKTKTANIMVYNPRYDSFAYELREGGNDIPNLISLDFHVSDDLQKLHMTAHVREFDIFAYTEFSQCSLLLQLMASFLRNSHKSEYAGISAGDITFMCDSIYANSECLNAAYEDANKLREYVAVPQIIPLIAGSKESERLSMNVSYDQFSEFLLWVRGNLRVSMLNGDILETDEERERLFKSIREYVNNGWCDEFWYDAVLTIVAGLLVGRGYIEQGLETARSIYNYQFLMSFLMSVKKGVESIPLDEELGAWGRRCRDLYSELYEHAKILFYPHGAEAGIESANAIITRLEEPKHE